VADGCFIRFVELHVKGHLTNAKPAFMLSVMTEHDLEAGAVFYFDADVVAKCHWSFFENWVRQGVALCLDVCYPYMPATHPFRGQWRAVAERLGFRCRDIDGYVNGGFVGVERAHMVFLETWQRLMEQATTLGSSLDVLRTGNRAHPFDVPDQDMLNVTMMATDIRLSVAGPDAMDFIPAGYVMSHAVVNPKPWSRSYLRSALAGVPPATADKVYWSYADGPIALFSRARLAWTRASLSVAAAIGRFYRRT